MVNKNLKLTIVAVAAVLAVGGCSQESKGDYTQAGRALGTAARETGKGIASDTKGFTEKMKEESQSAEKSASQYSGSTKNALLNDKTSAKVKLVLMTRSDLHISGLDVDTNGSVVTLRGSVPSQAERNKVDAVTKNVLGPNYTVTDNLTTSGS